MLNCFGRLLPFFIVMKFSKQFSAHQIDGGELGQCRGFRFNKGEWVIWSQDNYDRMMKSERESEKINKEIEEQEEREKYEELKEKFTEQEEKK